MAYPVQDLLLYYFMIGTGFTLLTDLIIRFTESSEPYTTPEVLASILLWPVMVCVFIVNFIRRIGNV
jgi:hypothetical protein